MKKLTISLMMTAMAVGCGDDGRGDGIVIPDSGPGADMGTTPTDMGTTPTDMGTTPTGPCADPVAALPGDFTPRCSAETLTCVQGAMSNEALQACLDADTTPAYMDMAGVNCGFCINYLSIQCADANGCHDQWATLNCCLEASGCADGDNACFQTACGAEISAFQACEPTIDCESQVLTCFPAM